MAQVRLPFMGVSASGTFAGAATYRTVGSKTFVGRNVGRPAPPMSMLDTSAQFRVGATRGEWRLQKFDQWGGLFSIRDITNYSIKQLIAQAEETKEFEPPNRAAKFTAAALPWSSTIAEEWQRNLIELNSDSRGTTAYANYLERPGVSGEGIFIHGAPARYPVEGIALNVLFAWPRLFPQLIEDHAEDQEPGPFVEWWVLYLPPEDYIPDLKGQAAAKHFEKVRGYSVAAARDILKEKRIRPDAAGG